METKFVKGLFFKEKHANAPDFVIGKLSAERLELIEFLQSESDEWVNMDIKLSKEGKHYIAVDTWKPDVANNATTESNTQEAETDDLPFQQVIE